MLSNLGDQDTSDVVRRRTVAVPKPSILASHQLVPLDLYHMVQCAHAG
jgi:hypothetical protein